MQLDWNVLQWDGKQYQAAGKHVLSFAAGGVAVAAAFHFISPSDASSLNDNFSDIYNGAMQVAKGVTGIAAVLVPIYTALKSAHNASPAAQIASVAANPQVAAIVTTPAVADSQPSSKVVSSLDVAQKQQAP